MASRASAGGPLLRSQHVRLPFVRRHDPEAVLALLGELARVGLAVPRHPLLLLGRDARLIDRAHEDEARRNQIFRGALARLDGYAGYTLVDLGEQAVRGRAAKVRVYAVQATSSPASAASSP